MRRNSPSVFGIIGIIVLVVIFINGIFLTISPLYNYYSIKSNNQPINATIYSAERYDVSYKLGATYETYVSFVDQNDNQKLNVFVGYIQKKFEVNEQVDIYYDSQKNKAVIVGQIEYHLIQIGLISLAIFFGVVLLFVKDYFNRRRKSTIISNSSSLQNKIAEMQVQESELAKTAFIISLFNILVIPSLITAPLSLFLGIKAIRTINRNSNLTGKGFAIFAIAFSTLWIIYWVFIIFIT